MDADERGWALEELSETIIGCAYKVSNGLGVGFMEKVYENALCHELRKNGLRAEQQVSIAVQYDGVVVGDYVVDLLVEDVLLLELKHAKAISDAHLAQTLNYLKATRKEVALILNFGTQRVQVKRVIRSNAHHQ